MAKGLKPKEMLCPQWMMTFGDFISLLVTFFVMLIAFSTFEEAKLAAMIGSLKGALGITQQPGIERQIRDPAHFEQVRGMLNEPKWLSIEELSVVVPDLQMAMKRFGEPTLSSERYVTVAMIDEGMAIVISVKPLFATGTSLLLPGNERMLADIGGFIEALANEVRVIGVVHESTAILTRTATSAWGLAIERAVALQEGLLLECGLPRERFGVGSRVEQTALSGGIKQAAFQRIAMPGAPQFKIEADDPVSASERMEIIIMGRRAFNEMSAEEVIVRDKWE